MARQVSAAEQAAQDAVADAHALRSALFEAEAANRDLHAQLRARAPRNDAAHPYARRDHPPFAFCFVDVRSAVFETRAVQTGISTSTRRLPRTQLWRASAASVRQRWRRTSSSQPSSTSAVGRRAILAASSPGAGPALRKRGKRLAFTSCHVLLAVWRRAVTVLTDQLSCCDVQGS